MVLLIKIQYYKCLKFFNIIQLKLKLILAKYFCNMKLIMKSEINYKIQNFFNKLLNNYRIT
jgi:hypothetical protein